MQYTKPRGTSDLIETDAYQFTALENILRYLAYQYSFKEVRTPIFESKELFIKAVGETSDIVNKEIYDFQDKGERWIALRPEGTAGTIRAIVENKMLINNPYPVKVFYLGPMFRYERPQSGRSRQFHQFGIEAVGNLHINDEVECISLAHSILAACQVQNYHLEINNLGDINARQKWIETLKTYFQPYVDQLSPDSQRRLATNPLRILDDKTDSVKPFVQQAPKLSGFLTLEQKTYFNSICRQLDQAQIKYTINENLVRGLDYYSGVIFEFISLSAQLTGQSTIIGGGQYNQLVSQTGGPDVLGCGFGLGMDRLLIAINDEHPDFFKPQVLDAIMAPLSEQTQPTALKIIQILRSAGFKIGIYHDNFKLDKHFKFADKNPAKFILILGDKELAQNQILIKDQTTKNEININIVDLIDYLKEQINE